jgi:hypothetical protein
VLLTRPPLATRPKPVLPFDLHVLSMPPAFNLSHDQTLQFNLRLKNPRPRLESTSRFVLIKHHANSGFHSPKSTQAPTPLLDLLVKEPGPEPFRLGAVEKEHSINLTGLVNPFTSASLATQPDPASTAPPN